MRHYFLFLILLLFVFGSVSSLADTTPSKTPMNEASVAVMDQSSTALQLGLQAAFSEVMMKMSGNAKIMDNQTVQAVSGNLSQVVQSYSYVQQPGIAPPAKPAWMLDVVFDQTALQQLLQTITQPVANNAIPAASSVTLLVTGVKNMNDYETLMQTLREQNGVSSVAVGNIDPDSVALTVHLTETINQLNTELSANHHFKPLSASVDKTDATPTLYYLWVGDQA